MVELVDEELLLLGEVGGDQEEDVDDEDDAGDDAEGAEGEAGVPVKGGLKPCRLFRCHTQKLSVCKDCLAIKFSTALRRFPLL